MLSKKDILNISGFVVLLAISIFLYLSKAEKSEVATVAFVDVNQVFEKFQLKQELQKKFEKETTTQKIYLDSLMFDLQRLKNKLDTEKKTKEEDIIMFNKMQQVYVEQKRNFEEYAVESTQKYDAQIIEQMTQYIKDYGLSRNYDFIFGKNEAGNVIYGSEPKDITEEVITYINEKYQGNI